MGGNKAKLDHNIFKNFKEGAKEEILIKAVLYVPGRILTAVCFPKSDVENVFPHLTLMLGNKWTAKLSNSVLQETCKDAKRFKLSYEESKSGLKSQFVQHADGVKI